MTLKNARHRFGAIGYEVERDVTRSFSYKARRIGTLAWTRAGCLEWLLTACTKMEIERS